MSKTKIKKSYNVSGGKPGAGNGAGSGAKTAAAKSAGAKAGTAKSDGIFPQLEKLAAGMLLLFVCLYFLGVPSAMWMLWAAT